MKAFPLEFRLRYLLHGTIYLLGFWAPWERYGRLTFGGTTAWTAIASLASRQHWLNFSDASRVLLVAAAAAAVLGAMLRVWGSAYLGASVVHSGALHGPKITADGPYRFTRNPLYLGTVFNALSLALLMPPSGAVVALALIALVQFRLIGAEESFLGARLGAAYQAYRKAVPRFWPALRPKIAAAGDRPRWWTGLLSEVYPVGTAISFLVVGSTYNGTLILEGVLIALGLSLIARAFIPATTPA